MLYHVRMDVRPPRGIEPDRLDALKAEERERCHALQRAGKWRSCRRDWWFFLAGSRRLGARDPGQSTARHLRERHDPAVVAAALTQVTARRRAAAKFGSDAGRMFFTGFTYRFAQPALRIKQLIADGAIGRVRSLRLCYLGRMAVSCRVTFCSSPACPLILFTSPVFKPV